MHRDGEHSNLIGIALILMAVVLLSSMDGAMKHLIESGYSVLQILAVRSWIVLPLLLLWLPRSGGLSALKTQRKGLHLLRVAVGFGAPFFFFQSLRLLPLADATVIFFGATFIMTALSVPILKEKVGVHRWSAIGVGFLGILVAANPAGEVFNIGALYAFCASVSYALFILITRLMGQNQNEGEGTFKLVFFFHVWVGLVSTVAVVFGVAGLSFQPIAFAPSMDGMGGIITVSLLVIVGHFCLMRAFSVAPIGVLAPFEYTALIWSALIGYLVWGDVPGLNFWGGASLVVASGIYMVQRENKLRKEGRATTADPTVEATVEAGPLPVPVPISVRTETD